MRSVVEVLVYNLQIVLANAIGLYLDMWIGSTFVCGNMVLLCFQ